MYNPLFGGRGLVARFAQYAGFRPKAAKTKTKAKDEDDSKDDDADAESDAPEHGDTGEDPSDDHMEDDSDDERMEDDDDDEKMEADDDDDDEKKKKARKKARRAESDDDDEKMQDDDDDKKEARRASRNLNHAARHRIRAHAFMEGRRAERARWTKILSSPLAASNLDTALRLAANTGLHSGDVIAQLRKVNAATNSSARRGTNPRVGVDGDGEHVAADQRSTAAIQSSWAKAFAPTIEQGNQRRAH